MLFPIFKVILLVGIVVLVSFTELCAGKQTPPENGYKKHGESEKPEFGKYP